MNDVPKENRETARQLVPVAEAVPALRDPYGRSVGLYGESLGDESEPSGLDIREYLRILDKRKWLILSIVAAFVVLSAVRTLMQTPLYTATVRLQIDREQRVVERGVVSPPSKGASCAARASRSVVCGTRCDPPRTASR